MDTIARTYQYRLYPTPEQEITLKAWQAACLEVQRFCISNRKEAYQYVRDGDLELHNLPNWSSQGRSVTLRRQRDVFWDAVPADTMSAVVKRVDIAYSAVYKNLNAGKKWSDPKFKRRGRDIGLVFRGVSRGTQVETTGTRHNRIRLAGAMSLGWLSFRQHRVLPDGAEIKQVHITYKPDGWYVALSCLIPAPAPLPVHDEMIIGVDIGCIHEKDVGDRKKGEPTKLRQRVAALSDGRIYYQTDNLKRNKKRLGTLQKLVSNRNVKGGAKHADPQSKRTKKRRNRIAKLHQTIVRQREATQEFIVNRLIDTGNAVAFEDLQHANMRKKGKGRRKSGLNKSLSTAAPAALIALTEQKGKERGREVVKVNAAYTSQDCSSCGERGIKKGLSVRAWTCENCGVVHDRDVNGALNVRQRGAVKLQLGTLKPHRVKPRCTRGLRGEGLKPIAKASDVDVMAFSMNREGASQLLGRVVRRQENHTLTTHDTVQRRRKSRNSISVAQLSLFDCNAESD